MSTASLKEVVTKIDKKVVQLPVFQRNFVWDGGKVQRLIESLYKGYPTGSFLMWTVYKRNKEINFLVDGQQRLTAIMWALYQKKPHFKTGKELNFELMFNPVSQRFSRSINTNTENFDYWISVPDFFKKGMDPYLDKFKKFEEIEIVDIVKSLEKLRKIEDYNYHIQEIPEETDIKTAVKIFNLVNSEGKSLNRGELAYASLTVIWPEFKEEFDNFKKEISEKYKYNFSVYFYMRLLAVINGYSALINQDFHNQTQDEIKKGWIKLKKILPITCKLFMKELKIFKVSEFQSQNPIYIIARYLALQSSPRFPNGQKEINMWIWWYLRAIQHQRYSGSGGDAKIDEDVKVVNNESDPIGRLVANIKESKGELDLTPDEVMGAKVSISNNVFNIYNLMLRRNGAIDWLNGTAFFPPGNSSDIDNTNDHHIFPQARIQEVQEALQDTYRYDALPNRAVVDAETNKIFGKKLPIEYMPDIASKFPSALEEQFIPLDPKYYQTSKFNEFMRNRSVEIADGVNDFIKSFSENSDISSYAFDFENFPPEDEQLEYKTTFLVHYEDDKENDRTKGQESKEVRKSVYRTLTAFANTDGGTLIIGYNETDKLVGVEFDIENGVSKRAEDKQEKYLNTLTEAIKSNVIREDNDDNGVSTPRLIKDPKSGKSIIFISVSPIRTFPPVTLNSKILVRESSMNKEKSGAAKTTWVNKRFKF